MRPSGAHTHPDSGGPGFGLLVIIALVVLTGSGAGTAIHTAAHAADELLHIVLITVAVLAGLAVAAGIGLVAWHRRRTPPPWTVQAVSPAHAAARAVDAPAAPQHGLPPPQIHLHLHGPVSAADIADLIARQDNPQPAAIAEDK